MHVCGAKLVSEKTCTRRTRLYEYKCELLPKLTSNFNYGTNSQKIELRRKIMCKKWVLYSFLLYLQL